MNGQPPFVGRKREIDDFNEVLELAAGGRGQVLLVAGHPGVGKTSTVLAFRELAEVRGFSTVWTGFPEQTDCPPYWAWISIVKQLSDLGFRGEASDLAEYFDRRDSADHERTRSWLYSRIVELLRTASGKKRLAIFIDDLQYADIASGAMIHSIADSLAELPVLMAITYRDVDSPKPEMTNRIAAAISGAHYCRRMVLRGMDIAECGELTHALSGWMPEAGILRRLHGHTEGNPLFLRHIVQSLMEQGHIGAGTINVPTRLNVPEGIREAIGLRLDRASRDCAAMLRTAAILGRNFRLSVLERISPDYQAALLDEANGLQLVRPVEVALGNWQFTHALIREVLYEQVPPMRRIRAHADAASAIEKIHGPDDPQILASLAYHSFEGQLFVGTRQVIERAGRAARHAMSVTAYEDAANQFRLALECHSVPGMSDAGARIDLALELAGAECLGGDLAGSMQTCRQAIDWARGIDDWNRYGKASVLFEDARWRLGLPSRESIGYLLTALEHSCSEDLEANARLHFRLAHAYQWEGRTKEVDEHATTAVAIARQTGNRPLLCDALEFAVAARTGRPETLQTRLKLGEEQLRVAQDCQDAYRISEALVTYSISLCHAGRFADVERLMAQLRPLAHDLGQPHSLCIHSHWLTMRATLDGEFQRAAALAGETLAIGRRIKGGQFEGLYGIQMFLINRERGLLAEFAQLALKSFGAFWPPGYTLLLAEGGKPDEAAPILEEFYRDGLNALVQDDLWAITMGFMAEACAIVGNARLAVHLFERLEPARGMALVCGPNAACLGPVDRVLGRLKACTGAHKEACEWFERALAQAREWKSPPTVLRTACDFAESLVADGSPTALRRARELEREVGQDAQLAGMRSIAERFSQVSRNLRDLASQRGFDQLTAREVEVLRLLASGASNTEISRKLGISFATVATHVRNILSKTDCRNRTAAANYARQMGLLSETTG